jgi:hypothetical protein
MKQILLMIVVVALVGLCLPLAGAKKTDIEEYEGGEVGYKVGVKTVKAE